MATEPTTPTFFTTFYRTKNKTIEHIINPAIGLIGYLKASVSYILPLNGGKPGMVLDIFGCILHATITFSTINSQQPCDEISVDKKTDRVNCSSKSHTGQVQR